MSIAIVVHGGAGTISADRFEISQAGCKEAALVGWHILDKGGCALDAVEAAVQALEDNPNYNAGTGSCLTVEGIVEMDAGLMDGQTSRVGAVAGVELIKNPIVLARKVLESPHVLLIGQGAQTFALRHGMSLCEHKDLLTERQYGRWLDTQLASQENVQSEDVLPLTEENPSLANIDISEDKHGTVGAVAIDQSGALAAATSTGGIFNKHPGRVGDSPLVGCGFYADEYAAISCTGDGEDFTRLLIAKYAADCVRSGSSAQEAAEHAIALLKAKASGAGGLIIVDHRGNVGFAWNSQHLARAHRSPGLQEPIAGVALNTALGL